MPLSIDLFAYAWNRPASIYGLHSSHDARLVFGDGQITTCQLFQRPYSMLAVVNRSQHIRAQQFGQLPGIVAVTLAALLQKAIATRITHHEPGHMWLQQVI